jgi:hypothetical protein
LRHGLLLGAEHLCSLFSWCPHIFFVLFVVDRDVCRLGDTTEVLLLVFYVILRALAFYV